MRLRTDGNARGGNSAGGCGAPPFRHSAIARGGGAENRARIARLRSRGKRVRIDRVDRARLESLWQRLGLEPAQLAGRTIVAEPADLASVGEDCFGRPARLAAAAADAWLRMRAAAQQGGLRLLLVSAFRPYEYQADLFARKRRAGQAPAEICRVLAPPGFSQHHSGCAIDVGAPGCTDLTERFEWTGEFRWLEQHAAAFGFTLPYPRGNAGGVAYEPWHWFFAPLSP